MDNFKRMMYGSVPVQNNQQKENSYDKTPSRVLGGLKAQNAHVKTFQIGEEEVSFPRIEYVKALEEEIKVLRVKNKNNETRISRLESQLDSLSTKLTSLMDSQKQRFNGFRK